MAERVIIALLIIAIGLALYRLGVEIQLRRARRAVPGLEGRHSGKYLILYFTSPTCAPCRTIQRPALETVQTIFGDQLQIVTIDVMDQPAVAERWGVMTLPTTLLFDTQDKPADCNFGVAAAGKLMKQLKDMGAQEAAV